MILDLATKAVKSIAAGNTQADLGIQSPHLPSGLDRIGRFLYIASASWIGITWYTAYANTRTSPGDGPKLILPGTGKATSGPSRSDPKAPKFAGQSSSGTGSSGAGRASTPGVAGPARVKLAKSALNMVGQTRFIYREVRPYPSSILANPCITDCSGFVTLLFKANGLPDPNGLGYNGQGYTGDLEKHGTPVKNPNVGDLAFWTGADHVAIVVSTNPVTIVEFGGGNAPIKLSKTAEDAYHSSFIGYRSYI